ncbi:MAG: thioredoxin domain-containing protein [Acidobacteria bacterium]|nr:thioredoxin domain-containing protein [Acidobacteriota bacterium]
MKKLFLALGIALAATAASAAPVNNPQLESFLRKAMTLCPSGQFSIEPVGDQGPAGFDSYRVTQTSKTEERCREMTFAMVSKTTNQIVLANVFPLEPGPKPLETRIKEMTDRALEKKTSIALAQSPLADGLRKVVIAYDTEYGKINADAYLDSSNNFLMAGRVLDRTQDPRRQYLKAIGADKAARKVAKGSTVEILEISDFQCPSCMHAHETLAPLLKKHAGKITYARLDLPFFEHHDWAIHPALIARYLQRSAPDKYWPFVDSVFGRQEQITAKNVEAQLREIAADLEIDWKKIDPILKSSAEKRALLDQIGVLYDSEVYATPTFVVNGQRVFYAGDTKFFASYIEALLSAGNPAK